MHFSDISFTSGVLQAQQEQGSSERVQRRINRAPRRDSFTEMELEFIAARDSFYLATVSETGWPYVQHRGGEAGFLQALSQTRLAFADYKGNGEYLTLGNLAGNNRVAMILVDYPHRRRLKILGRASVVEISELSGALRSRYVSARAERLICIDLAAYDWNCSQYIWPRYREAEIEQQLSPLQQRIQELETRLAQVSPAGN